MTKIIAAKEWAIRQVCSACGYEWQPRVDNPKACPRCKTRTDKPVKEK